ncbi:Cytochrome c oxidase subunit 6b-1-like protein [Drosera capensis]
MAEVAGQNPPSLSEQYLLPKEEKVPKPVEEVKVESPVSVETPAEEVVPEEVEASVKGVAPEEADAPVKEVVPEEAEAPFAAEEGNEAPSDAATDSSEVPSDAAEASAAAAEESTDAVEEQAEETEETGEETPEVKLETAPADFRFPTTNQTRHCFTRYIEYHRCIAAKGEDAPECNRFAKYYRSLCPGEWYRPYRDFGLYKELAKMLTDGMSKGRMAPFPALYRSSSLKIEVKLWS